MDDKERIVTQSQPNYCIRRPPGVLAYMEGVVLYHMRVTSVVGMSVEGARSYQEGRLIECGQACDADQARMYSEHFVITRDAQRRVLEVIKRRNSPVPVRDEPRV